MTNNTFDKRMTRALTEAEYRYVLFHINHHIAEGGWVLEKMIYTNNGSAVGGPVMPKSTDGYALSRHITIDGKQIPILFPCSQSDEPYTLSGGSLTFNHDLIKGAFYLLSCYQEQDHTNLDQWHRFRYEDSVQCEGDFIGTPVVNYYFSWIIEGIEKYCITNNINFKRKNPLGRNTLLVTHDVDSTKYLSVKRTLYRTAQVLGIKPLDTNRRRLAKDAALSLLHIAKLRKYRNKYWSFSRIVNTEQYYGFGSTWFFLNADGGPFDADYHFSDKEIKSLIEQLIESGNEVALHASINTRNSEQYADALQLLQEHTSGKCKAYCRQHFLAIDNPESLVALQRAGIKADCSVGFSAHEGFRNSYCLPYKPFDHKRQTMVDLWELPLVMMDTTVLTHRHLSYDELFDTTAELIDETRKFSGLFTLLWHNSTFDETYIPNIVEIYEKLHHFFAQYQMQSMGVEEILRKMENN